MTAEGAEGPIDLWVPANHPPDGSYRRLIVVVAIVAPMVYALLVNLGALDNPPAWDSAVTVSPAAITIVDMGFDVWDVAQLPSSPQGGPSTHATSLYTIGLAVLIVMFGSSSAFYAAHLISIALVGALAGATYLLARQRASVAVSALAAVSTSIIPVVVQQAADVYIDLPLAVITTLACWTSTRRRFWWTAALVVLGVAIKTSGVFLLPLLLFAKPAGMPMRRHTPRAIGAGAAAIIPFLLVLVTTHRFSEGEQSLVDPELLRSSISFLVATVDVFVMLAVYLLVVYGRARSRGLDRTTKASSIVVAGFFAVHVATILLSGTIAILPRYYIAILPAVLVAILPAQTQEQKSRRYRLAVGFVLALAVFSVINIRGDFYPRADDDFYVLAERSTRAQDYLDLQMAGTRRLVATGVPLLVERQVHFQLEYPAMGYVAETPASVTPVFLEPLDGLPEEFAMLIERRTANPLVSVEEAALDQGYALEYTEIRSGKFRSELIVASR